MYVLSSHCRRKDAERWEALHGRTGTRRRLSRARLTTRAVARMRRVRNAAGGDGASFKMPPKHLRTCMRDSGRRVKRSSVEDYFFAVQVNKCARSSPVDDSALAHSPWTLHARPLLSFVARLCRPFMSLHLTLMLGFVKKNDPCLQAICSQSSSLHGLVNFYLSDAIQRRSVPARINNATQSSTVPRSPCRDFVP